jgi:nucleoside-diphosphate-sugar epimerase
MTTIAITGATGFTGQHLARLLIKQGYQVHGLIRATDEAEGAPFPCHIYDLADSKSISKALNNIRPNKIIHLAAIAFVAHGNVDDIYRTNVVGTRNLLQAALDSQHGTDAILLASSANIYGNQTSGILTEDHIPSPANDYAVSKIAMEYVGRIYADRLPIIITRPFNYTGIGQSLNFLIPKIVDHVRRRADYIELGNLDVARDFSDVRAVAAAYAGLIEKSAAIGETFNICSGHAYSLHDILEMTRHIAGHEMEIRINPAFVRTNEVRTLSGSRKRIDSLIPALPNPPLKETLRWMLEA